jgi:DNA-binding NtrC family response regulator
MVKDTPLVVGLVVELAAKAALRKIDAEFLSVRSHGRLISSEFSRLPRLLLIEVTRDQDAKARETVLALRSQLPLTDVLVWFPGASGSAVRAYFHAGAKDVLVGRSIDQLIAGVESILQDQQILPRMHELSRQRSRVSRFESMLSRSETMWDLFEQCTRIAQADATVLIAGETGTGKELMARAVHRRSLREGRFVAANCASIPPELINSELFGHEKGAFTGADRAKKGLVMHANGGTLFLDEIGDMPAEGQLSLLRMLQEKRVRPVGALGETEVDVRVVAATNVPLETAVKEGNFREDLFYRLDVIRMNIPALRERPEDILFIFGHFIKKLAKHYGIDTPTWTGDFLDAMLTYPWPGNIRQLQNFSERLALSRPDHALTAEDFRQLRTSSLSGGEATDDAIARPANAMIDTSRSLGDNLDEIVVRAEREYLTAVLKNNRGRVIDTANQAGINRRTLLRKLKRHKIDKFAFK